MTEPTKENKKEDKDNQENNNIEDKDNLKDIEKDTKKDTDNSNWKSRLDVLKKRKEELRDDGTPGRKIRLSFLDWRIENKSPKQIDSISKKNDILKIEEEKKIEKTNNLKIIEPKPELDNVIEEQLETLKEETKQDELKANQETVSSISESTNQEKETEPENTEQHGTNDNTEDQNIPHSTIPEDEKTDLDKELE